MFIYTTLLMLAGLSGFFCFSVSITYSNYRDLAKAMVVETAHNYAGLYGGGADLASFVKTAGDTRITVIAPDGKVLADSFQLDVPSLGNHLGRPEVQAAANGSPAAFIRHSDSLGVDYIYYALKVPSGDSYVYLRASLPIAEIYGYMLQSLPSLVIVFLAIAALCFLVSRSMIDRITRPFEAVEKKLRALSNGEHEPEAIVAGYEEIDQITRGIDEVAQLLLRSIDDLRDEKNKLDYILDNMGDGLAVLDGDKSVALINSSALDIFGAKPDIVGKNLSYLSFDKALTEAVSDCAANEKGAIFELSIDGHIYLTVVKRLPDTGFTMVVLSDITESRENAKRREEFFANASHELKTPLTAIKGFNELTAMNNQDAGISKFIDGIGRETERMLTLIGDMLKLSELENTNNVNNVNNVPVSLEKVVKEVFEALSPAISEKSIAVEIAGDAVVNAAQEHIYELVKNILENAVRYNNQGGRVSVAIESDKKGAGLFVFDDGIGISPEEQTRVFERFYRVEKSRSQRNGGTGLGLSIVKHICALYGWNLSLKSKLGVGTEVAVLFV